MFQEKKKELKRMYIECIVKLDSTVNTVTTMLYSFNARKVSKTSLHSQFTYSALEYRNKSIANAASRSQFSMNSKVSKFGQKSQLTSARVEEAFVYTTGNFL